MKRTKVIRKYAALLRTGVPSTSYPQISPPMHDRAIVQHFLGPHECPCQKVSHSIQWINQGAQVQESMSHLLHSEL